MTKGGKKATPQDIQAGDEVRASLAGPGADIHVQRIEILTRGSTGR